MNRDIATASAALAAIPADLPRSEWVRVAMACKAAGLDFEDFDAWSQQGTSYRAADARDTWRSIRADGGVTAGTLYHVAHEHGYKPGSTQGTSRPAEHKPVVRPQIEQRTSLSTWGRALWAECEVIAGTAADYLTARRCVIPPADGDLRWHRALKHPSGYVGPALVALVTHDRTRQPLSLHRTWIRADGTKATHPAKMMLAGHGIAGGVVRLWPDEAVTRGLGVAEGIETALSLAHAFTPVWALIDAGHLAKFGPLPGIESLTIARDNDPAGIAAARACAGAWAAAGVEVFTSTQEANDLNDALQEAAA